MKYEPCELSEADLERLSVILGGPENVGMAEESEFVAESGCPPGQMEAWLEDYWNEYDISEVLAGRVTVGAQPLLLAHQFDGYFTVRLFSPSGKLVQDNAQIEELQRLASLPETTK